MRRGAAMYYHGTPVDRYTEIIVRGLNVRTGTQTRPNMPVLKKTKTKKTETKWNHLY